MYSFLKRIMDAPASALGLLLLSPVLAIVALPVRLKLGSPVLFRQVRPGLHGRPFTMQTIHASGSESARKY